MYSQRANSCDKNGHVDCSLQIARDDYEEQIHEQQYDTYKPGERILKSTLQIRRPRKRRDNLNTITRILRNTACYTSATCCVFIIEAYHPHPFRPVGGSEAECSGTASISMKQLGRLLRYLQPESNINEGGTGGIPDVIESKSWAFMVIHHSHTTERSSRLTLIQSRTSALLEEFERSRILSDPPPLLFLAALLIFSLAISGLWRSQARNRHRNLCVGVVMMSGVLCALYNGTLMNEGKGILAWCTIFALACSSVTHWMLELFVKGEGEGDVQVDEKVMIREGRIEEESGQEMLHEKTGATEL